MTTITSLQPEPVAILNTGSLRWHLGARYPDGPLLTAEACNLDDANPDDLIEYSAGDIPEDAQVCDRCVAPVFAVEAR